ncbi:MAG: hypothetical protein QOI41_233 [Myxococcales bacterium]|nr:hypothetical protein [Myxococcales bacterium]
MAALLVGAVVRCKVPDLPPGPEPIPTGIGLSRGPIVAIPAGATLDTTALIASLKEMKAITVILQSSATEAGESVSDRVALAVTLQRELAPNATVLIGTYDATAHALNGKPMAALLQPDPTFLICSPGGLALDPNATLIDKVRLCSQDVGAKLTAELTRVGANPAIGCYVPHEPELSDGLDDAGKTKLHELFRDASSACAGANRAVAVAMALTETSGDPTRAANLLHDALLDTGINRLLLDDGAATFDASAPTRAVPYYDALRIAIAGQPVPVQVWADLEAFDCEAPGCARKHPTNKDRYIRQLCAARGRVEGIVADEYLHDLAERPLVSGDLDASADLRAIFDDTDAAAQLHRGYLDWIDAGAPCPR